MVHEVIREEVEAILAVDAEHADEVGRVMAISEQFDAHSWGQVRRPGVDRFGDRKSGKAGVSTSEHACVWVAAHGDPFDLTHITLGMNGLVPAASPAALKFITWGVKDGVLADNQRSRQVPRARLRVLCHLTPDLIRFLLSRKRNIRISIEIRSILGRSQYRQSSADTKLEH